MKTFPNGNVNSPKETAPPEQSKDLVSTSFYPSMVEAIVECDMQVVNSDSPKETALSELPPDDAADPTSVIGLSKPPPEALSASMFPSAPLAPNTDPKVANGDPPKEAAPQDSANQTSVTEPSPSESLSGVKPPPESLSMPPALQASAGSSSRPSYQSDSAANWEGELALSILNSGPRDAATGRRQSTMANSMSSAAAAVGAFAAKSDPSEEGAKKKKMEDENNRRRHSSYQPSTFDDRLRRKLERSRSGSDEGGSDRGRRRSSRMSLASSVGTVESISENKPSNFFEESTGFASIVEGRQDCKQEESEQSAAASSCKAGGLKSPPESIEIETYPSKEHLGHRRKPGSSAEQYQEFIMQKIATRSDVGMTYSELKRQEEEAAAEEAAATVSATTSTTEQSGGQTTTDNVIGVFHTAAPRVRDEEEEKVEISSEDDIVEAAQEAEVEALQEEEHTIDAVCAAMCAAVSDEKKTLSKSFAADAGKIYHYRPSHSLRASRCDKNSPFSSMVNERKKIVVDDYTSDPENLVDNTDEPPRRVSNPDGFQIQTSHHRTNPDISSPDSRDTLASSFTGVLDRIIRNGHRTRSLEDVSLPAASNGEAGRRGTYAFEGGEAEQSYALRELADMVEAQDVVHATLVTEEKPIETVEAIPMDNEEDTSVMRHRLRKRIILVWGPLLLLVAAIVAAILTIELGKGSENDGNDDNLEKVPERVYNPTVVQVKKEGVLRCGVPEKYGFSIYNSATGEKEGISADYCKAVAAAVIGSDYEVELIDVTSLTRFTALAAHEIDLLIWGDTHTMERDFHEKAAGVGFQFTDVYFYDGLGFAGDPLAVQCADNFDWRSADCRDLKICVNAGVTHVDVLLDIFPQQNIIVAEAGTFFNQFVDGNCKVIAGEQNDISEIPVRINGYSGEFGYGQKVLSKEPLAMVTRKNDQSWTDVVNWVLRALIHAELTNVTQETAGEYYHGHSEHDHPSNSEINLILALEEVGNYGEIYARNMEEVVPRKGLNLLYAASEGNKSGLLYSHPTGVIDAFRHEFAPSGKINQILDRRKLICGVLGNEEQTMDADYCRALAASLFEGEVSLVDFVAISNGDNLMNMLDSGEIDAISGVTIDFHSDIISSNETASGLSGLAFSQPYFYRGNHSNLFYQGAPGPKAMATSQTDSDWSTYVYWVVANLIWAEENGITSEDFRDAPEVKTFGDQFEWMFRGSILGVGNYGEIYERNMDTLPPRANQNLLNDGSSPQLWHPCDSSSGNCMV